MKTKFSSALSLALIVAMLVTSFVLADTFSVDNDVFSSGNQATVNLSAAPGATVNTSGQIVVDFQGSKHLVAGSTVTFAVNTSQTNLPTGYSVGGVSLTVPSPWESGGQFSGTSSISFTAPSIPNNYSYTVKWDDTSQSCVPSTGGGDCLTGANAFTINLEVTAPTNTAPSVAFSSPPTTANEGDTKTFNFAITDTAGDTHSFVTGFPDCGSEGTLVASSESINNTTHTGTFQCLFPDGLDPTVDSTVRVQVQDQGSLTSNIATTDVTVNNVAPVVAAPSWANASVACRTPATLTGISFSDAGVIDYPWNVNINWSDASSDAFPTNDQGAQANQTHTYNTPGTYSATVTVTDKDGDSGSATTSSSLTVLQTYTVDFLPPFDDSSPSGLIVNKMKNGRVVPVKITIFDVCTQSYVTDPTASVTIKVTKTSGTGTGDPVEEYADAGQSSAGTNTFRWTTDASAPGGGFWIYNLDSKALGLFVNSMYRVDVEVDSVKATVSNWAVLQPVK